jgi:hypothetical protein
MANTKVKTKTDETVPADITDSDFVSGLYKRHGECRFCHTYRMLRYHTDDISQEQVDTDATLSCTCQEALDYKRIMDAAEKAKGNLRALNREMNANFPESVEKVCDSFIDLIAEASAESVTIKSGSRSISIKKKGDFKINVGIKKLTKADIDA